jgi:hypothetical protein
MNKRSAEDPNGLIHEAFRIENVTPEECRTIFLDWALSLPDGSDQAAAAHALLARHAAPGHPMTRVLEQALAPPSARGRRGGHRARRGET